VSTPTPRQRLTGALFPVRAVVLVVLLVVTVVSGLDRVPEHPSSAATAPAAAAGGCADATATVRTPAGAVRQVRFATGWAVYTGARPGELLSLCVDGRPVSVRPARQVAG
jgi:hypothetical protein